MLFLCLSTQVTVRTENAFASLIPKQNRWRFCSASCVDSVVLYPSFSRCFLCFSCIFVLLFQVRLVVASSTFQVSLTNGLLFLFFYFSLVCLKRIYVYIYISFSRRIDTFRTKLDTLLS